MFTATGSEAMWLAEGEFPDWSPDGHQILFMQEGDIWTVPASGGTPTRRLETPERELWPQWSPDGRRILFARLAGPSGGDIWIADVRGMEFLR